MELMETEVSEGDARRLSAGNRLPNRGRQQDLAAMACEADAGCDRDSKAHVPGIGQGRSAGVQADPDPDRETVRPRPGTNLPLNGERRAQPRARLLEDGEHLVGLGIDFSAAMLVDRRP